MGRDEIRLKMPGKGLWIYIAPSAAQPVNRSGPTLLTVRIRHEDRDPYAGGFVLAHDDAEFLRDALAEHFPAGVTT